MRRIKLVVSYDGTHYCGWQIQPNGITIEEVLNQAISKLVNEEVKVIGASRTDSGVHALGNVAVFDTESKIPADKFAPALNQRLPQDIIIQSSCEVEEKFHPRYCDTIKTYEYRILNRAVELPKERNYAYFIYKKLNIEEMKKASTYFLGEHDFKSFCSLKTQTLSTVRTIYSLDLKKIGDIISVRITGNGFLYNMVRIIVGTLIQVGLGRYKAEDIPAIIKACDRQKAGKTAVAKGLTLVEIQYL